MAQTIPEGMCFVPDAMAFDDDLQTWIGYLDGRVVVTLALTPDATPQPVRPR